MRRRELPPHRTPIIRTEDQAVRKKKPRVRVTPMEAQVSAAYVSPHEGRPDPKTSAHRPSIHGDAAYAQHRAGRWRPTAGQYASASGTTGSNTNAEGRSYHVNAKQRRSGACLDTRIYHLPRQADHVLVLGPRASPSRSFASSAAGASSETIVTRLQRIGRMRIASGWRWNCRGHSRDRPGPFLFWPVVGRHGPNCLAIERGRTSRHNIRRAACNHGRRARSRSRPIRRDVMASPGAEKIAASASGMVTTATSRAGKRRN